jgi:uncharacterized protein (DUF1697 family)
MIYGTRSKFSEYVDGGGKLLVQLTEDQSRKLMTSYPMNTTLVLMSVDEFEAIVEKLEAVHDADTKEP